MWKIGINKSKMTSDTSLQIDEKDNQKYRTNNNKVFAQKDPKVKSEVNRKSIQKYNHRKSSDKVQCVRSEELFQKSVVLSAKNAPLNSHSLYPRAQHEQQRIQKSNYPIPDKHSYQNKRQMDEKDHSYSFNNNFQKVQALKSQIGIQTQEIKFDKQQIKEQQIQRINTQSSSSKFTKTSIQSISDSITIRQLNEKIERLQKIIQTYQIKLIDLSNQHNTLRKNINSKFKSYKLLLSEIMSQINTKLNQSYKNRQNSSKSREKDNLLISSSHTKSDVGSNPEEHINSIILKINQIKSMNVTRRKTHHNSNIKSIK